MASTLTLTGIIALPRPFYPKQGLYPQQGLYPSDEGGFSAVSAATQTLAGVTGSTLSLAAA